MAGQPATLECDEEERRKESGARGEKNERERGGRGKSAWEISEREDEERRGEGLLGDRNGEGDRKERGINERKDARWGGRER